MLKTFSIADIGRKRQFNQDYVFSCECPIGDLPNVFIVADGMGGHNAGDFASKCTVDTMVSVLREGNVKEEFSQNRNENAVSILRNAIETANRVIRQKAAEDEAFSGMGTTVVAATFDGKTLEVANVGDSRLYIINKEIRQITRDHSLVEEMVRMGGIDRSSARIHPDKNIITRAIGALDTIEIDFFQVKLNKGDVVLMCSDGLTNMLDDEEIRMIVSGQRDVVEKADELVKAANSNGGKDNIAVILIEPIMDEVIE